MRRVKLKNKNSKNTMSKILFIVFFCVIIWTIIFYNLYSNKVSKDINVVVNEKIDKILYLFFNDLITEEVINKESVNNLLEITRNSKDEILTVNYDLEKTYKVLSDVSKILKQGIIDLENGQIDVKLYDRYLGTSPNGLVLNVPLFLSSNNVFLNSLGPKIPVLISFNETLLTNVKTRVTNYGLNNALLEIYITVEMQKLIITPVNKDNNKFSYDILIGALVVNGSVPNVYGGLYESGSNIFDIPMN